MELIEVLQTVPEFAELSNDELEALDHAMVVKDFPDGHELITEGVPADDFYLLVEGEVAITHKKITGRGVIDIMHLGPGEIFGLIALIDRGRRSATVKAVGPVRVATLPRAAFNLLYEANSPIAYHFQHIVTRQLMHDFRQLIKVMRAAIFDGDEESVQRLLGPILHGYSGIERRRESQGDEPPIT